MNSSVPVVVLRVSSTQLSITSFAYAGFRFQIRYIILKIIFFSRCCSLLQCRSKTWNSSNSSSTPSGSVHWSSLTDPSPNMTWPAIWARSTFTGEERDSTRRTLNAGFVWFCHMSLNQRDQLWPDEDYLFIYGLAYFWVLLRSSILPWCSLSQLTVSLFGV